jgi:hypothetical protein
LTQKPMPTSSGSPTSAPSTVISRCSSPSCRAC